MTLLIVLGIAVVAWLFAAFATPLPKFARVPLAAALALGMAGYSWQGRPNLPSAPAMIQDSSGGFGEAIDEPLNGFTDKFGAPARWIAFSDALARRGRVADAAQLLNGGVKSYPKSVDMWFAFGNALVNQAGGQVTPAALLAFDKVASLSPEHPGPDLFRGLEAAQKGELLDAAVIWKRLLAKTPADAPYREDLETRIKVAELLHARQTGTPMPSRDGTPQP